MPVAARQRSEGMHGGADVPRLVDGAAWFEIPDLDDAVSSSANGYLPGIGEEEAGYGGGGAVVVAEYSVRCSRNGMRPSRRPGHCVPVDIVDEVSEGGRVGGYSCDICQEGGHIIAWVDDWEAAVADGADPALTTEPVREQAKVHGVFGFERWAPAALGPTGGAKPSPSAVPSAWSRLLPVPLSERRRVRSCRQLPRGISDRPAMVLR